VGTDFGGAHAGETGAVELDRAGLAVHAANRDPQSICSLLVHGRESDVLQVIGIPWDDGAGHITCPYPDHADDNPSWRWDQRKARAHCTCVGRSHSIFDVVMRREGIEFEMAKLRVAEILSASILGIIDGRPGRSGLRGAPSYQDDHRYSHFRHCDLNRLALSRVAGPRSPERPASLVHDHNKDHLQQVRAMVLGVAPP
jgi:hypothetical protein